MRLLRSSSLGGSLSTRRNTILGHGSQRRSNPLVELLFGGATELLLLSMMIVHHVVLIFSFWTSSGVNGEGSVVQIIRQANSQILKDRTMMISTGGESSSLSLSSKCMFNPFFKVVISNAQSINQMDKYYDYGILSLQAVQMIVDYINTERCGIQIDGNSYSIELHTYGDESDMNVTRAIGNYAVNQTNFMLAGYSSNLTGALTPIADVNKKVIVSGGASSEAVFANKTMAFGILPTSVRVLDQGIAGVAAVGARTVAAIYEDGLHTCKPVPDVAAQYGLEVVAMHMVPTKPNATDLDAAAYNMSQINPDVVVTCTYDYACGEWVRAMRRVGWSPKAQIFSICIGMPALETTTGFTDLAYMMGVASWNRIIQPSRPDAITGWTPEQFASNFEQVTYRNASYQHTAAAAAVSALVQAIELSNSIDSEIVAQTLASTTFYTMYGETYFDENGQNNAPSFLLQYDKYGVLQVVRQTIDDTIQAAAIVYPMPSWLQRDCMAQSACETSGGTCDNVEGTCNCTAITLYRTNNKIVSMGNGSTAFCKIVIEEDMNHVNVVWIAVGIALVVIQFLLSCCCAVWTLKHKNVNIVSASQPEFLLFIAFGCFILSTAIIPLSAQGAHRYLNDEQTLQLTTIPDPHVNGLDAACMAAPWLSGIGFATVFSALFAKIWRVKRILQHAERFRRQKVEIKDVMFIMIVMLTFEVLLLLSWQLVSPLRWNREVLVEDEDGFPLESIGYCSSDNSLGFMISLALFNGGSLIYALYLCWITRDVPSDFSEGTWITMSVASIFQILLLGVPVLIISSEDRTAAFFVRAGVIFLCSSTVSLLIFGPKIWRMKKQPDGVVTQLTVRRTQFSQTITPHLASNRIPPIENSETTRDYDIPINSNYGQKQSVAAPKKSVSWIPSNTGTVENTGDSNVTREVPDRLCMQDPSSSHEPPIIGGVECWSARSVQVPGSDQEAATSVGNDSFEMTSSEQRVYEIPVKRVGSSDCDSPRIQNIAKLENNNVGHYFTLSSDTAIPDGSEEIKEHVPTNPSNTVAAMKSRNSITESTEKIDAN